MSKATSEMRGRNRAPLKKGRKHRGILRILFTEYCTGKRGWELGVGNRK